MPPDKAGIIDRAGDEVIDNIRPVLPPGEIEQRGQHQFLARRVPDKVIFRAEGQPEDVRLPLAEDVPHQAVLPENALGGLVGLHRLSQENRDQLARQNFRFDKLHSRTSRVISDIYYYTTNRTEKP